MSSEGCCVSSEGCFVGNEGCCVGSEGCCVGSEGCCVCRCGRVAATVNDGERCRLPPKVVNVDISNKRCGPFQGFVAANQLDCNMVRCEVCATSEASRGNFGAGTILDEHLLCRASLTFG